LLGILTAGALLLAFVSGRDVPETLSARQLNAIAALTVTAILCDAWFLRISFANVYSSVVFVPLFASVALFDHPIPMLMSGFSAAIVETFVRRKPAIRVWFNTVQFMVAVGLGTVIYHALGGANSTEQFSFALLPFAALVATFFVVNQGSVALAVAYSNGLPIHESWDRIGGGARLYDFLASSLAVLLAFLYVKLQLVGLTLLVLPLFLVRQLYQMNLQLQEELEEKLELMVKAMEARDPYTSGHSRRVAEYASALARELGLNARQVDVIRRAALLHDVGKIYEEFAPILRKASKLSAEERIVMRTHVVRSAELVGTVGRLRGRVLDAIKHHHENFDGSGYPDGLAGEEIPIEARIIMVADTIDAMTTDRPYRKALSLQRALEELGKFAGNQFDPKLVTLVAKSTSIHRLLESPASADMPVLLSMESLARARRMSVRAGL
jgi:putative nucleotidyltransferase with HDIG domain